MIRKFLIAFTTLAVVAASAATYHVKLLQPTVISGTTLKAGEYKVEVGDNKAVFKAGKETAEAPVKVESVSQKYTGTTFRYDRGADGSLKLRELKIGGSNVRLLFTTTAGPSGAVGAGAR